MRSFLVMALLTIALMPVQADEKKGESPVPTVVLERTGPVQYEKDIEPIFANRCFHCHSGTVKKNGFDAGSYEGVMKGGRSGPAVIAGKVADSSLVPLVGRNTRPIMPPRNEAPLTPQELALIKLWIEQGAKGPSGAGQPARTALTALSPAVHAVRAVAVSPDKSLVAAGRGNQIHLFQAGSGAYVRTLTDPSFPGHTAHLSMVESLTFSPDGRTLASGSHQEVKLWDVQGKSLRQTLAGFADRVVALTFSRDGKYLATGGGAPSLDGEIKLLEAATGKVVLDIKNAHTDTVFGLSFSPDGGKLASCSADRLVKIFELPNGKLLKSFEGHTHHVLDVCWKGDGKLLASGGADKVIKVWDFEKGEQLRSFPTPRGAGKGSSNLRQATYSKEVSRLAFVGDKAELAACSGDQVTIWNADTGESVRSIGGAAGFLAAVAVSPDGSVLAAGGEQGTVWLGSAGSERFAHTLTPPATAPKK
jgi:WD40 repeat protein